MDKDNYERVLNCLTIAYGFVSLNFHTKWKWWQRFSFILLVSLNILLTIQDMYFYYYMLNIEIPKHNIDMKITAIRFVNLVGDFWSLIALFLGFMFRKKLELAADLFDSIDGLIKKLGDHNRNFNQPRLFIRVYLIVQWIIAGLRLFFGIREAVRSRGGTELHFAIELLYKNGIFSCYYSQIIFVYHKIYLRYRAINYQLSQFVATTDLLLENQSKLVVLVRCRHRLAILMGLINGYYAISVGDWFCIYLKPLTLFFILPLANDID